MRHDPQAMADSGVRYFRPNGQDVRRLAVGDKALGVLGWGTVKSIFAQGTDTLGRVYVCFYVQVGKINVSSSYKEGELVRTLAVTRDHNSAELDQIERNMLQQGVNTWVGNYPLEEKV